jgi:DNA-binding NarL/FixJ family response regulator
MSVAAVSPTGRRSKVAVVVYSADRELRRRLEHLLRNEATTLAGVAGDVTALARLIETKDVDVVLADSLLMDRLVEMPALCQSAAFVVMIGDRSDEGLDALTSGARAILPRSADDEEIAAAIHVVDRGLAVVPRHILDAFVAAGATNTPFRNSGVTRAPLTPRELEVLSSMADGASNKTIARRLGISAHTVKFHVAAILAKLDADSRTEAVTKAAQLGLVML